MITLTPEQQQDVARRFQGLATRWNATTRYRSNTQALRNHPVYQELVAWGNRSSRSSSWNWGGNPECPGSSCLPGSLGRTRYRPRLPVRSTRRLRRGSIGGDDGGRSRHREAATGPSSLRSQRIQLRICWLSRGRS